MFDDLHELDTRTWRWKKLAAPGSPAPRYAHQMKALGHYLIITHGFIAETLGNGTVVEHGDPDIYFYDLNRRSFVDRYSPQGISARELDTEWLVARTGATNGVSALCFLLVLAVALAAAYYLVREVRAMLRQRVRVRARPQRPAAERGALRSMVDSYAETLRQSAFLGDGGKSGRASLDGGASQEAPAGRRSFALVRVKEAPEGHVVNPPTASEGATTVVGSSESGAGPARSQSTRALQATMRHARILDASPGETPYVSRKLTLSAHLPAYRAPRPAARHQVVRFSEHQDADDAAASGAESDVASDGDGSISSRPTTESDDLDAALASPPETPSTHSDTADAAAGLDADEDEAAPLRLMNVEADSR
ncbi:hypothetical protein IWQ57_005602 [Coemansia nantahalensis]|uniref:Uncharacterized protein n=1 Tax=Coemansia nantahalensis TaxID=2789366 RepID=A0ACC1JML7_9FUNG|nr:hypothetical protein IWQ57_005602 [Coemansia nantahalensis]